MGTGRLIIAIVLLIICVIVLLLADRLAKRKKKPADKTVAQDVNSKKTPAPEPEQKTTPTITPIPSAPAVIGVENNLADELAKQIEPSQPITEINSLAPANRPRGRIAQYIQDKNYQTFNFDDVETEIPQPTITKEDYKKLVSFGHITDPK